MCTLHANSAREALVKTCTLPLLAGENVSAALRCSSRDLLSLGCDLRPARGFVVGDVVPVSPAVVKDGSRPNGRRPRPERLFARGLRPGRQAVGGAGGRSDLA